MVDLVSQVLRVSGVRTSLGTLIEAGEDWERDCGDHPGATVHVVTAGRAWLHRPGCDPRELAAGDVVLLPANQEHRLAGAPDLRTRPGPAEPDGQVLRLGTPPWLTRIMVIHYDCDHDAHTQVLDALPDLVHVGPRNGVPSLDDTVRMRGRELSDPQIATTAVLDSLIDIMLIQILRAWLPSRPSTHERSWLGVLDDSLVRAALELIHRDPARPWTTESLAQATAVSRATLSRRFVQAIGSGPATYLAQWRMDLAAARLRDTQDSLDAVAAAVGYGSVAAFSRAFVRARGCSPGRYRVRAGARGLIGSTPG
ncbi:AraC family transcriptional regulator [Amycolatopsis solani]|uniref:AraC family transcriptional regulator n=1 Tax=Amycolatopsis solani TaxID=3028615 RepID=UPI0025B2431A|nr:AraC family transcriptional regulator [Amycolatopsis sp. MEP2-6]